jgi:hypothetical protein
MTFLPIVNRRTSPKEDDLAETVVVRWVGGIFPTRRLDSPLPAIFKYLRTLAGKLEMKLERTVNIFRHTK